MKIHVTPAKPLDKKGVIVFLRDEQRISWIEIYLKVLAFN